MDLVSSLAGPQVLEGLRKAVEQAGPGARAQGPGRPDSYIIIPTDYFFSEGFETTNQTTLTLTNSHMGFIEFNEISWIHGISLDMTITRYYNLVPPQ